MKEIPTLSHRTLGSVFQTQKLGSPEPPEIRLSDPVMSSQHLTPSLQSQISFFLLQRGGAPAVMGLTELICSATRFVAPHDLDICPAFKIFRKFCCQIIYSYIIYSDASTSLRLLLTILYSCICPIKI